MKIAIVHDWLIGGGAEKVVEQLHQMYPDAPIYTSYCTPEWRRRLGGKVVTGYLQRWPFPALRKFVPTLRGLWFSRLNLKDYDLVISSSGAEAKYVDVRRSMLDARKIKAQTSNIKHQTSKPVHVRTVRDMQAAVAQGAGEQRTELYKESTAKEQHSLQHSDTAASTGGAAGSAGRQAGAVHVSYIHAPTHYYWDRYDQYLKHPGFGPFNWLARVGLKLLVGPMRRWDYRAAQRPNYMIANSSYTQKMIRKYYHRDSLVIHPPVSMERFQFPITNSQLPKSRHGFVVAGRQTPYKRIDLAVAACTKLNLPLTVIGNGPEHKKLVKMAGPSVKFVTSIKDNELAGYFQNAEAFIFPGLDDFGIVAVEALAAGTPVIAYQAGGALDYIKEGETGLFFDQPNTESLCQALKKFDSKHFARSDIIKQAQQFSAKNFRAKFSQFLDGMDW